MGVQNEIHAKKQCKICYRTEHKLYNPEKSMFMCVIIAYTNTCKKTTRSFFIFHTHTFYPNFVVFQREKFNFTNKNWILCMKIIKKWVLIS